jgi:hypothetical protein
VITLFSTSDQASNSEPMAVLRRYISYVQLVAIAWTLTGIITGSIMRSVRVDSPLHMKLQILSIGCLLVAGGLYSALTPIWLIQRNRKA